ncbi:MAG: erythromycin esterase family protein [Pseudomonadota bacterium]
MGRPGLSIGRTQRTSKTATSASFSVLWASLLTVLLSACGGGSGGEATSPPVAAPEPVPAPVNEPSGLLTDAELLTPEDSDEALIDADATRWFADNAKTVRSLSEDEDFSDLEFFEPLLAGKSLVLLGESSHGVEEYSQAKLRLIRYLHEEQGYDVLAFEAGLFDCELSQEIIEDAPDDSLTAENAFRTCVFSVWSTQTVLELFEYVRETQATTRPLRVTGFDVQASGIRSLQRATRTAALFQKLSPERALEVDTIEFEYLTLIQDVANASGPSDLFLNTLRNTLLDIRNDYAVMADELLASIDQVTADGEFTRRDVLIAAQYLRTTPYNAEQFANLFEQGAGGAARDAGMALNLIALKEEIYPDDKIIAWAHNAHLRHRGTGFVPDGNMGKLVHDQLEAQMYTVGFYMYRGTHAFNDREIRTILPPLNRSLEAIFYSRRLRWLFLDLENAPATAGHEWINEETPTWAWGEFQTTLRLAEEYDGLFMIDTVAPPSYIN